MTIRRGSPRVNRPTTPIFFTACTPKKHKSQNKMSKPMYYNKNDTMTVNTHITNSCPFGIVEKRDKIVSRVRNNSTENTGDISTSETHTQLQTFGALILGSGDGIFIDILHNGLKGCKLHHCVCSNN